jgi:hypothetical protein
VTELRASTPAALVPPGLADTFRPAIGELVERVTQRVQRDVASFAGSATGRRHRLITMAVTAGVGHFLEIAQGRSRSGERVDDLFRRMGYGEAVDGHDLGPLRAALKVATRECWSELRGFAIDQGLTAADLGRLGDALFDYVDHLHDQVAQGYAMAERAQGRDVGQARERLLDALLAAAPADAVFTEALHAGWSLPDSLVVLAASFHGELPLDGLPDDVLVRATTSPAVAICAADAAERVAGRLRAAAPGVRVAMSWGVPAAEAATAHGWCLRALHLVDRGVIAPVPVVRCRDHTTQLWLHAEPRLRQELCQDLLQPLLAETPNSREILSETLLAWLESRDSAPAIAARLDVHPQTVRYRWKRINELFGESLHDPEFVVQVTMLLKASVPLWKAGDQSDFERFRAQGQVE